MSKGMLLIGIILLGMATLAVVNVVNNVQTGNELDYYLLEETTEAAMLDAVDIAYYRVTGIVRMDREMFLESFVRRFANNVDRTRTYDIKVIDLNETPPKVSIQVDSNTVATVKSEAVGIRNKIDAILETKYNDPRTVDEVKSGMSVQQKLNPTVETPADESVEDVIPDADTEEESTGEEAGT